MGCYGIGEIQVEWDMAASMRTDTDSIQPDLCRIVHGSKSEEKALAALYLVTGANVGDRALVPQHFVNALFVDAGSFGLEDECDLDGALLVQCFTFFGGGLVGQTLQVPVL